VGGGKEEGSKQREDFCHTDLAFVKHKTKPKMPLFSFNGKDIRIIEVSVIWCHLYFIADVERSQARCQPLDDIVQVYTDPAVRPTPE
jgi:hypothetical protein